MPTKKNYISQPGSGARLVKLNFRNSFLRILDIKNVADLKNPYQSEKSDPDPHRSKHSEDVRVRIVPCGEPWTLTNGGLEAQNGAVEVFRPVFAGYYQLSLR
jgi:hypothetical protein